MVGHNEAVGNNERLKRELMLDKTLADSFPASDPPLHRSQPLPGRLGAGGLS